MATLGFAPDTPFVIDGKGLRIDEDCLHGSASASTCFELTEDSEVGDVCKLTVPYATKVEGRIIVGWQCGPESEQKPTVYTLHRGFQLEDLAVYDDLRQLLAKVPVNSDEKIWIGGKDLDKVGIETLVLQDGFSGAMCKFYFIYLDHRVPAGAPAVSVTVVEGKTAKEYSVKRDVTHEATFHLNDRQLHVNLTEHCGRFLKTDKVDAKLKYDPERVAVSKTNPKDSQYIDLYLMGVKYGKTAIYDECDDPQFGYKKVDIAVRPRLVNIKAGTGNYTDVDGPLHLESYVGDFHNERYYLRISTEMIDGRYHYVGANYNVETDMLSLSMQDSKIGDKQDVEVIIKNTITKLELHLLYSVQAAY